VISHAAQEIIPIPKLAKMTIAELKAMFQEGADKVVAPVIDKALDTQEIIAAPVSAEPMKVQQEPKANSPSRRTKMLRKLTHRSFKLLFKTRCPVSYEGLEHLPIGGPFLLCANQASHLDIVSLIYASKRDANDFVAFTAKDHLNNSLMNRLKKVFLPMVVEFFPIDRHAGNSLNWEDTLVSLKPYVDSNKILTIFPEGTRTKTGEMQDFKLGASYLAHQLNLPVVPAYISGTYHCLPHNKTIPKKGPITITFGKPLVFDEVQVDQSPYAAYQNFTEKLYQDVVSLSPLRKP
jgi:1-acyl-sn-glycerol-3-phosphate acyltransferase